LSLSEKVGNPQFTGYALVFLGTLNVKRGELESAKKYLKQGLIVWAELKNNRMVSDLLNQLAEIASREGDYTQAEINLSESKKLSQELGNKQSLAVTTQISGKVALAKGDLLAAKHALELALKIFQEVQDKKGIATALENLVVVINRSNTSKRELLEAVRYGGRAAGLKKRWDIPPVAADEPEYQKSLSELKASLGVEPFTKTWDEAQSEALESRVYAGLKH